MATRRTDLDHMAPDGGQSSLVLTSVDDGRTICCEPGSELVVMLPESASTGHRWAVDAVDDEVLSVAGSRFTTPSTEAVGAGGTNAFTIRVVGTGEAALRLKLWRPWEGDRSTIRRFGVTVRVPC
jgi:predicted secreted protein